MFDETVDVAVIGSGPGGSVAGAELAKRGISVKVFEKSEFPRFHIGESLTGSAGQIIRQLGLAPAMAEHQFPEKPGVNVIGREARNEFFVPVLNPTWQVRRSIFDTLLRDVSIASGAEHVRAQVTDVIREGDAVKGLSYVPEGSSTVRSIGARVVVDASGQSAFLSRQKVAGRRSIDHFSTQIAFYAHFEGVRRDPGPFANNTSIFYSEVNHWAWLIPISPTVDSLGIVLPGEVYRRHCKSPEEAVAWGIQHVNPELRERLSGAVRVEQVRACRDYSYRIDPFVGEGWVCIGDAHRFLDPIFSFGVSFAMTEAQVVTQAIAETLETGTTRERFEDFARYSNTGQDIAADLIRYFWKYPVFFGYQMQNRTLRTEVIRLFGGECFHPEGMRAPALFREGLERSEAA